MSMKKLTFLFVIAIAFYGCKRNSGKLLDVPNLRQAHEYSCGPGAVQAVLAYYGVDFRESQLINFPGKPEPREVRLLLEITIRNSVVHSLNTLEKFHCLSHDHPSGHFYRV